MLTDASFTDYFSPDYIGIKPKYFGNEGYLGQSIIPVSNWQQLSDIDVAIISVPETRNAFEGAYEMDLQKVKESFYALANIEKLKIADLGSLVLGAQLNDTYQALSEVIGFLAQNNIIVLLFGGTHDLTVPIQKAINQSKNTTNLTILDNRLDLGSETEFHSKDFIFPLVHHETTAITIAGFQNYFVPEYISEKAKSNDISLIRLGKIRQSLTDFEPIIRDTDFLSIDMVCLRMADFPSTNYPSPNGLYSEEVCSITKFAGLSDRMKVMGIFEFNPNLPASEQSTLIIAQAAWHFILGISQRHNDYPKCNLSRYKKIYVKSEVLKFDLVFYQNETNHRFWVEIPNIKGGEPFLISCSESDYRKICNNEIPERIWESFQMRK